MLASAAAVTALVGGSAVGAAGGQTTAPRTATAQVTAPAEGPIGYLSGLRVGKAAGDARCDFFEVDLVTGELTQINPVGEQVPCAAVDSAGSC